MKTRLQWKSAVLFVLIISLLLRAHTLAALGAYLVKADPVAHADIVLVLDGDPTGRRILTGAQLVRDGYAPQVLVSGSSNYYGAPSSDLAISFAERNGFPESSFIHLDGKAHSTEEEATLAIARIRQAGFHRVLLVTSNYHTRRAAAIYRRQAPDLTFITIAAPEREYDTPDGWWHNREARKTFLYEREKTIAVWLGGL